MNREVKFKIWDKKLHVMWEPISLEKLLRYLIFQNCPNADAYEALKDHFEKMVWLESTGLCDKNGKEIFEGDILRVGQIGQEIKSSNPLIEVVWDDEDATFRERKGTGSAISYFNKRSVVVGNFYENPELLKEQHENK